MLWFSSHTTLAAEEIPLLLEAGFRVVPSAHRLLDLSVRPTINDRICNQWKDSVDCPPTSFANSKPCRCVPMKVKTLLG